MIRLASILREVSEIQLKKHIEQEIVDLRDHLGFETTRKTGVIPKKFWVGNTISDPKTIKDLYLKMISWKLSSDPSIAKIKGELTAS